MTAVRKVWGKYTEACIGVDSVLIREGSVVNRVGVHARLALILSLNVEYEIEIYRYEEVFRSCQRPVVSCVSISLLGASVTSQ